jgi:hypothetical protein
MIEVDFIAGFIVCVLSFIAGLVVGRDLGPIKKRGNYEPIEHVDVNDLHRRYKPAAFPQKQPNVITIIHGPKIK